MLFRFAQRRPSDRCRWSSNDLCLFFTLEELRYEEPPTEAGRTLAWPFFCLRTVFVSRSDRRKKESKQTPVFESRQKKTSSAVEYTSTWVRSIKRKAAPAVRSTGRRPPRGRGWDYDLRNQRPGSPCTTVRLSDLSLSMPLKGEVRRSPEESARQPKAKSGKFVRRAYSQTGVGLWKDDGLMLSHTSVWEGVGEEGRFHLPTCSKTLKSSCQNHKQQLLRPRSDPSKTAHTRTSGAK